MALKVYDPDQISIIIGGHSVRGFADGQFLNIVGNADLFSDAVGSDGDDITRTKNNDQRATITLSLMQTSDSNDVLDAIANSDQIAPNGAGVFDILIRDRGTGRAMYKADGGWINKQPDAAYDRTPQPRAWTIRVAKLIRADRGS